MPRLFSEAAAKLGMSAGRTTPSSYPLLMLSHIDDDHANGLLELTQELIDAMSTHQRPLTRGTWSLAQQLRRHHQ